MKKFILGIILLLKRPGFILRGLAILICYAIIFIELVPDLMFNIKVGKVKSYTEKQILDSNIDELPLYLKISDVGAIGDMYVTETYQRKDKEPRISAIIYPVYNLQQEVDDIDELKKSACNIVVKDWSVKENTIDTYFDNKKNISGKFNKSLIDNETRKLLTDGGYNIADNCIVIEKGLILWSNSICIIGILGFGLISIFLFLSLIPTSILYRMFKQKEKLF